jgi:hypothetical protein
MYRLRLFALALACSVLYTLSLSHATRAATITVTQSCTLKDAIMAANENAESRVCAGTITGDFLPGGADTIVLAANTTYTYDTAFHTAWGSELGNTALPEITSAIIISGNGAILARDPNLNCPSNDDLREFRFFTIVGGNGRQSSLTLHDLTLSNGCADSGGAIVNYSSYLTLDDSYVIDNEATVHGGGIFNDGGTTALINSHILSNTARYGGGVYSIDSTITFTNTRVSWEW